MVRYNMSAEECEKVFGGTWTLVNSENLDQFIIASEMSDAVKEKAFAIRKQKFTISRSGDTFYEKATLDGVDYNMSIKMDEEMEIKDTDMPIKTKASYCNGVWHQETTPLNKDGGKKQVMKAYMQGDVLLVEFTLPDVPGITLKRIFKKSEAPNQL